MLYANYTENVLYLYNNISIKCMLHTSIILFTAVILYFELEVSKQQIMKINNIFYKECIKVNFNVCNAIPIFKVYSPTVKVFSCCILVFHDIYVSMS